MSSTPQIMMVGDRLVRMLVETCAVAAVSMTCLMRSLEPFDLQDRMTDPLWALRNPLRPFSRLDLCTHSRMMLWVVLESHLTIGEIKRS